MPVLSRLLPMIVPCTCTDFHSWDDQCIRSAFNFAMAAFSRSLKIYIPVILGPALFTRRQLKVTRKDVLEIGRMSSFVGLISGGYHVMQCLVIRLLGGYHILSSFLPAFLVNLLAIQIPSRSLRPALALYCATVCCEVAYLCARFRGWLKPVKNGEVLLFALAAGGLMFLYEADSKEAVDRVLRSSGRREKDKAMSYLRFLLYDRTVTGEGREAAAPLFSSKLYNWLRSTLATATTDSFSSVLCRTIFVGLRGFLMGFFLQAGTHLVTTVPQLLRAPSFLVALYKIAGTVLYRDNVLFGLFIGAFVTSYKLLMTTLRCAGSQGDVWNGLLSGSLSALWMILAPQPRLALYLALRVLHMAYVKTSAKESNPNSTTHWLSHHGSSLIYAFSCAVLFHVATFEPHNLPSAYWKFLVSVSNKQLERLNRAVLEPFGTQPTLLFK